MVSDIEFLDEAFKGILHHHERIDGRGYPMGLRGERDPRVRPGHRRGRRVRLDDDDALLPRRPHASRRPSTSSSACKGTQFDPRMVEALVAGARRARRWDAADRRSPPTTPTSLDHDDPTFGSTTTTRRVDVARRRRQRADDVRRARDRRERGRATPAATGAASSAAGACSSCGRRVVLGHDHRGLDQPAIAVAFGVFIAVGEVVRVNLPGDREAAPLGAAGALAYALLADFGGVADRRTTVAAGRRGHGASPVLVGAVPHVRRRPPARLDVLARRILVAALAAAAVPPAVRRRALGPARRTAARQAARPS